MEEGEPIEHRLVTRAIATAQKRVETHNFEIRKHLLEYDDVMNKQREVIYGMRRQILDGESQEATVAEWREDLVAGTLDSYAAPDGHPEDWDLAGLGEALFAQFDVRIPGALFKEIATREGLQELVAAAVGDRYAAREAELGADLMRPGAAPMPWRSISSGRITCSPSITSRRALASAATVSATR